MGFLVAGFVLSALGTQGGAALAAISDVGITLLLFTIGLKLDVSNFLRREVWATAAIHCTATSVGFAVLLAWIGSTGAPLLAGLDLPTALALGFALSFSSTVFAVKVFEQTGEARARHAVTSVGILIVQDLLAVVFLAITTGAPPSVWALALFGLPLARRPLFLLLGRLGHGELLILFGFAAALAGRHLFEFVGLKGDLGSVALGMLLATHAKGKELADGLLAFKDLFLVGFFLSIGLAGLPSGSGIALALLLAVLAFPKGALFFGVLARMGLRARSSLLAALALASFSEFGLILVSRAVAAGWLPPEWLPLFGLVVAASFVLASLPNALAHPLYERLSVRLRRFESESPIDAPEPIPHADVLVFGMGRVGSGAYEEIATRFGSRVIGVDRDPATVQRHREAGRRVIRGDATDGDFWSRCPRDVQVVLLAMSDPAANLHAVERVRAAGGNAFVVAAAKFEDEARQLREAGADAVFNFYAQAGAGLAEHAVEALGPAIPG